MVVLITGASDGIGYQAARKLAALGHRIYGISRSRAECDFMRQFSADVRDRTAFEAAVRAVLEEAGHIDLLLLCAGISLASPADSTEAADARDIFDINFWGCVEACALVLPHMKEKHHGRVLVLSSMTGLLPLPYLSFYSAGKAALLAYACCLRMELRPYGIPVCVVLPGGVRTRFTQKRKVYRQYTDTVPGLKKAAATLGREEQSGLDPERVAEKIVKLSRRRNPPPVVPVGGLYRLYALLERLLPRRALLWAIWRKYA